MNVLRTLLLFILFLSSHHSFCQSIIYVNSNATGSNNGNSWSNAYIDLHDAFTKASNNDQIWVAAGVYKPTNDTNKDSSFIIKNKSVRLYGGFAGNESSISLRTITTHSTIISGEIADQNDTTDNSNVLIKIDNATSLLLIDGFIFERSAPSVANTGYGGPLSFSNASNVVIKNCTFRHNYSISSASINLFYKSNAIIDSCLFTNTYQGSIMNVGNANSLKIKNSTFSNNHNLGFPHIQVLDSAKIEVTNCLIKDNIGYSFLFTNGTYNNSIATTDTSVYLYNNVFQNNTISYSLLELSYGNVVASKCNVTNTSMYFLLSHSGSEKSTTIDSCHIQNNTLANNAFYINTKNFRIENSDLISNTGTNPNFLLFGSITGSTLLKNINFKNNNNLIPFRFTATNLKNEIIKCDFENNICQNGSIYYIAGDSSFISDSKFTGNTNLNLQIVCNKWAQINRSDFNGNTSTAELIYLVGSNNVLISDCNFNNNSIANGPGLFFCSNSLTLQKSQFLNNSLSNVSLYYLIGASSSISECVFSKNTLTSTNTILFFNSGNCDFTKSIFSNNKAIQGDGFILAGNSYHFTECNIDSNTINGAGTNNGLLLCNGSISIKKSTFIKNTISQNHGIWLNGTVNGISDCTISYNSITGASKSLFASLKSCSFYNTIISGNTANLSDGIHLQGNSDTLSMCRFENNNLTGSGVLFACDSNCIIDQSTFINNTTVTASALNLNGDLSKISSCNFEKNNSSNFTGMLSNKGLCLITNSIFSNNVATYGSVLYNLDSLVIYNSRFNTNGGYTSEGTIANTGFLRTANCIFYHNKGIGGGAIYNTQKNINTNLTIVGNTGYAIYNRGASYNSVNTNCIFFQNKPKGYLNDAGGTYTVKNCLLQETDANALASNVTDPLLDLELKLKDHSPAFNKGTADTTGLFLKDKDYFSNSRIFDDTVDIGAFELQRTTSRITFDTIHGNAYLNADSHCMYTPSNSLPVSAIQLKVTPGDIYTSTDGDGKYKLALDTGKYTINATMPAYYQSLIKTYCPTLNYSNIPLKHYGMDTSGFNFGYKYKDRCYDLSVGISTVHNRRRPCLRENVFVTYYNSGYDTATNVKIKVKYPTGFTLLNSVPSYTTFQNNILEYTINQVLPFRLYTIVITDSINCIPAMLNLFPQPGQTTMNYVRYDAEITPRNDCTPTGLWDFSDIKLSHFCDFFTENVVVKNAGIGGMIDSSYIDIFWGNVYVYSKFFRLKSNDSIIFKIPTGSTTTTVRAAQNPNNPFTLQTTLVINNCNQSNIFENYTPGIDTYNKYTATTYVLLANSLDPNEKSVEPVGFGNRHYISPKDYLNYKIEFQNTGNDTAYQVVITDTLDSHLDLTTFEPLASSHTYTYEITGRGTPVIKWTFKNINLSDSTTNNLASQGFVSFRIKQTPGNPDGTRILNKANIYFDYNEAIITNETFNEIKQIPYPTDLSLGTGITYQEYIANTSTSIEQPTVETTVTLFPDPMKESATLQLGNNLQEFPYYLVITDLTGTEIRREVVTKNDYALKRNQLKDGMYFYRILDANGNSISTGKFVTQ